MSQETSPKQSTNNKYPIELMYQYCNRCDSVQAHTHHENDIDGEWYSCDNCEYKDENPELFESPQGSYCW